MSGATRRVVIVGGGVAGPRTAEALRAQGFTGELLGLGAENHPPYARPPLSKAMLHGPDGGGAALISTADMRWRLGVSATGLDLDGRLVDLDNGSRVEFDAVVLATGVRARTLPGAAGALALRTVEDAQRLRLVLHQAPGHLVVIGAGFIGSEVAVAARAREWMVTVVDADAAPLAGSLGPGPAQWLWEQHRVRGVHTRFGAGGRRCRANTVAAVRRPSGALGTLDCGAHHARYAAAALTGREPQPEAPAVFWTDFYQHRIQVIGLPRGTESEPEPRPRGFCVRYRSGAVAVNWPQRLPALQREIEQSGVTT